jgi:acyl-coenzyme A synthetase/AMP-(fatty) acid ligase
MIKASGYRISPEEIEEIVFSTGLVKEVVAVGLPDEMLGQKVALAVVPRSARSDIDFALRSICAREMPPYMQPGEIVYLEDVQKTPNGKPDRTSIASMLMSIAKTS